MVEPARWFHLSGGVQQGPVDLPAIRDLVLDGTVRPDTYVWSDGMPEWMPAARVPALVPPPAVAPEGWEGAHHDDIVEPGDEEAELDEQQEFGP